MKLHDFPRCPLTFGPSPVHQLDRLTQHLGGATIWAKREDCNSGIAFGGNKIRKPPSRAERHRHRAVADEVVGHRAGAGAGCWSCGEQVADIGRNERTLIGYFTLDAR